MRSDKEHERQITDMAQHGKVRLFVDARFSAGANLTLDEAQTHYLIRVMRLRTGDRLLVFNGKDGEWQVRVDQVGKRRVSVLCEQKTTAQSDVPDVWLAFAPIKKTPADYVAQKATELGVRVLQPVLTERTVARRVNVTRLKANAVEAAEQAGRLSVPEIREPMTLAALLASWPKERGLIFCDEAGEADPMVTALAKATSVDGWAVLTGPEGGFTAYERGLIRKQPFVVPVTLGPRIIRADTAALAALALWQAVLGDWRGL